MSRFANTKTAPIASLRAMKSKTGDDNLPADIFGPLAVLNFSQEKANAVLRDLEQDGIVCNGQSYPDYNSISGDNAAGKQEDGRHVMDKMEVISCHGAPKPAGHYSQATAWNDMVFVS